MDIDPLIYEANNRPLDDFCGLSAAEMHRLVHEPLSRDSVVKLKEPITDNVLDSIPLFRLFKEFIGLFNDKTGSMKLTGTGSLQQGVLSGERGNRTLGDFVFYRCHEFLALLSKPYKHRA